MTSRPILCSVCDPTGCGRSCARLRCYCGHPECWAFASYAERPDLPDVRVRTLPVVETDREVATWHDQI